MKIQEIIQEIHGHSNPNTITMDVPLLIRMFEIMREDVKSDAELHNIVEQLLEVSLHKRGQPLTMSDYSKIIQSETQD